jgi:glycosyltransferase involved in cell wall biosynthesis
LLRIHGVRRVRPLRRRGRLLRLRVARRVRRARAWLRRRRDGVRRLRRRLARRLYLRIHRLLRKRLMVLHRPSVFVQFWKAAGAAAAEWGPDVVHAHDLNALPAAFGAVEGSSSRVPIVYDSHELWRHRNRVTRFHPVGKVFDALQERRLIGRCDLVITVSPLIWQWLGRRYRLPEDRGVIVRNVPWRSEPAEGATVRELAGLRDERILLYTGRVTSGRGLEEAVDALKDLPADLVLVMLGYGDPDFMDMLWARADAHGVRERVRLVPPVASEQVAAVAASADLALVAIQPLCLSYEYALPNKLFEAIQARVPVVATGLPEIAAVVRRYGLGELFSPGDARGFRDAVHTMLRDLDRYRAGVRAAAADLVWENESVILLQAYERMLEHGGVTAPARGSLISAGAATAGSGPS